MKHPLFFFFLATVSKSLLTVLGTLPSPAVDGRGKCHLAGLERSRKAWTTPESGVAHTFHPPTATTMVSPAAPPGRPRTLMAREVRAASTPPACSDVIVACWIVPSGRRRAPASHGAGPSGGRPALVSRNLIQRRVPSQGCLPVVSLPPHTTDFFRFESEA
jgi:hypothetical protein